MKLFKDPISTTNRDYPKHDPRNYGSLMPSDIVVLFLVLPVRLDLNCLSDLTVIYYIQYFQVKIVLSPLIKFNMIQS